MAVSKELNEFYRKQSEEMRKDPFWVKTIENYDDMPDTSKWFTEEENKRMEAYNKMLCEKMEAELAAEGIVPKITYKE